MPRANSGMESHESVSTSIGPDDLSLFNICPTCNGKCCVGRTMVTAKERVRIVKRTGNDSFVHWRGDLFYLDHGTCAYLVDGLCSVQKYKPFICQIFPLVPRVVDGQLWLYSVGECETSAMLPPGFLEKAKALAKNFFSVRSIKDYADYWNQNKTGDFNNQQIVFRERI